MAQDQEIWCDKKYAAYFPLAPNIMKDGWGCLHCFACEFCRAEVHVQCHCSQAIAHPKLFLVCLVIYDQLLRVQNPYKDNKDQPVQASPSNIHVRFAHSSGVGCVVRSKCTIWGIVQASTYARSFIGVHVRWKPEPSVCIHEWKKEGTPPPTTWFLLIETKH